MNDETTPKPDSEPEEPKVQTETAQGQSTVAEKAESESQPMDNPESTSATNPYAAPASDVGSLAETEYEYTGFWLRLVSYIIDSIIIYFIITLPLSFILGQPNMNMQTEADFQAFYSYYGQFSFVSFFLTGVYYVVFWHMKGATPGKMALGMKVINAKTGEKPSVMSLCLRYVGYIVSAIPIFLGYMWIGWDKRKQGFHDKIGSTIVVRPRKGGNPVEFE
ncbi:RDD family protein [Algicola sagamiensis]|uniref:RDD family protein n=1 Tax=Algicola sagamiensis TaxID=163869 RepID=UPI000360D01F|nr:RDD family protein [Algicola sagamiensis]